MCATGYLNNLTVDESENNFWVSRYVLQGSTDTIVAATTRTARSLNPDRQGAVWSSSRSGSATRFDEIIWRRAAATMNKLKARTESVPPK
jgi:hypothetical protein